MAKNPLWELHQYGQSLWLDNIRRGLITAGELARMIEEDGIVGVTSNPTIFEKAIGGSTDYDAAMRALVDQGLNADQILEALIFEDIRLATDLLRPLYERSEGRDGFVSIEVSPHLAHDTQATTEQARRYWRAVDRPNLMVKVPATPEGLPAIQRLTSEGINVNITLLFSVDRYEEVMEAYLSGLEQRIAEGQPVTHIASVASFFVSRVDTAVDRRLEALLRGVEDPLQKEQLQELLGRAAIANAKEAYQRFKRVFTSARFAALREKGARVQRPLWASTSTKNPNYRDTLYLEELIGPDTVNTLPHQTILAFKDHGVVRGVTLEEDREGARETLRRLAELGIDMSAITQGELVVEGVQAFADSYDKLRQVVADKRASLLAEVGKRRTASLGRYQSSVDQALRDLEAQQFSRRLWAKDPSLWKTETEHQRVIAQRLGWLNAIEWLKESAEELVGFAEEVQDAGLAHALLLGMGGSSLASEVLRTTFGVATGFPDLAVLDSTVPAAVLRAERSVDLSRTLFIVSSKSGTTTETLALSRYFYEKMRVLKGERVGEHFVAITDAGTPLQDWARQANFRRIFLNPSDIGGRYSALSYFGMVPAAIMGLDIKTLLDRAEGMLRCCDLGIPLKDNPGAELGAILGQAARVGRDKVTLVTTDPIGSFGHWVEQLLAESTGKAGAGLIPIQGEPLGDAALYGHDRLFVQMRVEGNRDEEVERRLSELEVAGHPVVRIHLSDGFDLGQEFFRWEVATAVAGSILGINPFDEPNVQESKDNTRRLLGIYQAERRLPEERAALSEGRLSLYGEVKGSSLGAGLAGFLDQARPGDYLALMAYLPATLEVDALLQAIRLRMREQLRLATMLGYGPRYLHSTGQLHKGGPDKGLFIQLTAEDGEDIPIPGQPYTFGLLKRAQALGDFEALRRRGRRVTRMHLGADIEAGLKRLLHELE